MSRYRLYPTRDQERMLLAHCGQARFVWNLAVEQAAWWRAGRKSAPGYLEQCRQLTAARAEFPWLAEGSQTVQQQALRDFSQAMTNFFNGTHGRPTWRKAGRDEGFRVVGKCGQQWGVRRVNRWWGEVRVPKVGWIRLRWSRALPDGVKSYRVTRDRAGRWHVAFAAIPSPIPASQALFRCVACGYACNADVNAARNIAVGHSVTARGGDREAGPVNREPHLLHLVPV